MTVSLNIKTFRKIANISQEDLAEKTGLTRNYLALIESGKRQPSLSTLRRISKVLKVPVSILTMDLDGANEEPVDKLLLKAYELATKYSK